MLVLYGKGKMKEKEIDITKTLIKAGFTVTILANGSIEAFAETSSPNFTEGLKPLLRTLQDLAEPVSYGFMIKGFMQIMSGDEHQGTGTIKHAILGYVGIQWIPRIYAIIRNI